MAPNTRQPGGLIRAEVAGNPSTPAAALELLASAPTPAVRTAVAANPAADPATRDRLLQSVGPVPAPAVPELDAQRLLSDAAGSATGPAAITGLLYVWGVGLWRPSAEQRQQLAAAGPEGARLSAALAAAGEVPGQAVTGLLLRLWRPRSAAYGRLVAVPAAQTGAGWPVTDPGPLSEPVRVVAGAGCRAQDLAAAAGHHDPWIRAGAALHPHPGTVLDTLCGDPDPLVAGIAGDVFTRTFLQAGPLF